MRENEFPKNEIGGEMLLSEAEKKMEERILQGIEQEEYPHYASLAALSFADDIYIARRLTEPHLGLFSLIGGKSEQGFGGDARTETSQRFKDEKLEIPTDTMARELAEEVFPSLSSKSVEELKRIFELSRTEIIYDPQTNFFCFNYMAKTPDATVQLDPRELADLTPINKIDPSEINALTRLFLFLRTGDPQYAKGIRHGKIEHIALPSDIVRIASASGRSIDRLTKIKEPGYILEY